MFQLLRRFIDKPLLSEQILIKYYLNMAKGKGNKKVKKTQKAPPEDEDDVTMDDNGVLDPEDLEYFQDSHRSFAFLQEVTAE